MLEKQKRKLIMSASLPHLLLQISFSVDFPAQGHLLIYTAISTQSNLDLPLWVPMG